MELKTVYFEKPGSENTETVLNLVRQRAEATGSKKVVVASNSGDTALKAMDIIAGAEVVTVSHVTGFREPNMQQFDETNRHNIESRGGKIITAAHAFSGISIATRNKYDMPGTGVIIADTLRLFGEGTKVCCEITLMAADAGLVRTDEDIVAIGGTGRGADTALVLRPTNSRRFFELKIREILCKPHL